MKPRHSCEGWLLYIKLDTAFSGLLLGYWKGQSAELPLVYFKDLVLPCLRESVLQGRDGLQRHSSGLHPENLMQILKVTPRMDVALGGTQVKMAW